MRPSWRRKVDLFYKGKVVHVHVRLQGDSTVIEWSFAEQVEGNLSREEFWALVAGKEGSHS